MQKTEAARIKEELRERGTTLYSWAIQNGFLPRTVYTTVDRWADRTDRTPHGGFGRTIMEKLRQFLAD